MGGNRGGCGGAAGGFAAGGGVVVGAGEVLVPVALAPLQELEVVLHFALDEGFDGDCAVDAVAGECACVCVFVLVLTMMCCVLSCRTLEYLEIRQIGVLAAQVELDLGHGDIN